MMDERRKRMAGSLTDIAGILVGHYTDAKACTGCTAVIFEKGAVAGVDVRGSAPGTRETDLLRGFNLVERINAVMLSGGSAFGLDAASGAMEYLEARSMGMDTGAAIVPIVPAAVIYDLGVGDASVRPGRHEGFLACEAASHEHCPTGNVGAGTGATVGKAFGPQYASKGGLGTACFELSNGVKLAALAVVNALGDVYDPETGALVASAIINGKPAPCLAGHSFASASFTNTTLGVIATNAQLTREQANKLASMAHDGLALAVRPVHTAFDGDTIFGASTCEITDAPLMELFAAAPGVMAAAILSAFDN